MVNRGRRSRLCDAEKHFYRFVLFAVGGYFLGCSLLIRQHHSLIHVMCASWLKYKRHHAAFNQELGDSASTEPVQGNIYIGMMSTKGKLPTRMLAAARTWVRVPGVAVEVVATNNGTIDAQQSKQLRAAGVSIVQLDGVDDNSYPPQRKSFTLLRHMYDQHLGQFDWFLRLDDDTYVNFEHLRMFLNTVNASRPLYIGHPGYGKHAADYLQNGENYCMGGPGVIYSRDLLRRLRPHLTECVKQLYTEHEDIEVGRCVRWVTDVQCTQAWDVRRKFIQNYQGGTYASNIMTLSSQQMDDGIMFHANKDSPFLYRFHSMILKRKIFHLLGKISKFQRHLNGNVERNVTDYVESNSIVPLRWNSVVHQRMMSPSQQPSAHLHKSLGDVLLDNTNRFTHQHVHVAPGRRLKESRITQSYYVVNPLHSLDIVSQMRLDYEPTSVRYQQLKVGEQRTNLHFIQRKRFTPNMVFFKEPAEIPSPTHVHRLTEVPAPKMENRKPLFTSTGDVGVNFLTSLSGRSDNFIRFLHNFENTFLTRGETVNLIITYFSSHNPKEQERGRSPGNNGNPRKEEGTKNDPGDYNAQGEAATDQRFILENVENLQSAYPDRTLKVITMPPAMEFSRGAGLQRAAEMVQNASEIIFFCDVDLIFSPQILMHIRRNTILGRQVYYPVFFSQYDPDVVYADRSRPQSYFHFGELDGFWRHFSYGMVSLYKGDFMRTSGFDLTIRGWGLEDLHLVNAILAIGLDLFKCTEPSEVHVYHDKTCDPTVLRQRQLTDCRNSRAQHYGPKTLLHYLWRFPNNDTVAR